jgi:predicted PurR-regulated permease PerM
MARGSIKSRRDDLTVASASSLQTLVVVFAIITALYIGRSIAIPIAIAVLISFSLGPIVSWLRHRRFGRLPAVMIAVFPALLAIAAFAYVVTTEIGRLAVNIPAYQTNIETKLKNVQNSLPSRDMLDRGSQFLRKLRSAGETPEAALAPNTPRGSKGRPDLSTALSTGKPIPVQIENPDPTPVEVIRAVLGPLIDPLSGAALVLLFVVFFLAERENLRDRVIRLAGARDLHRTTMAMDEAGNRVSRYLLRQTLVNSAFGVVITCGLFAIGLPNAALWGGIAAILRFVPYFGVTAAAILPLALAFAVDPGWTMLFWTGGLFLGLEMLVGNVIEPYFYGSSTGISAVALIVSAIFWTWLWGTVGLLLATPLTVCIAVLGRYVPQLAFLDVLLGNEAPLKPEESFYQRLLAGDPDEAASLAEELLKLTTLIDLYDDVVLPALLLAERDLSRGELDGHHAKLVLDGLKVVIENLAPEPAKAVKGAVKADLPDGGSDDAGDIILCVSGRTDLDEAAALLLAQVLELDGQNVIALSREASVAVALPDIDPLRIKTICLSYLDYEAAFHARYLGRRFRRRIGADFGLIVGFWGGEQNVGKLEHLRTEARANRVVVSLRAAVQAVSVQQAGGAGHEIPADLTLDELAARISDVVSRRV